MKDTYDRLKDSAATLERMANDLRDRANELAKHAEVLRGIRTAIDHPEDVVDDFYSDLTPMQVASHLTTVAREVAKQVTRVPSDFDFVMYEITDAAAQFAKQAA